MAPEFKDYQLAVLANARALCARLQQHGYSIVSGGTDNHLLLVDLKPNGVDGSRVQQVLDEVPPPATATSCSCLPETFTCSAAVSQPSLSR